MINALQQLCNENDASMGHLKAKDRDAIERITKYIKTYTFPEWEMQTFRKDLIGMATETNARGKSLQDEIGDEKEFCISVVQNMKGKNRICLLLYALTCIFGGLFILSAFKCVGVGFPGKTNYFSIADMMYLIAWFAFCMTFGKIFGRKAIFFPSWKRALYMLGYLIVASGFALLAESLFQNEIPLFPVSIIATGIFGALGLLFNHIRMHYKGRPVHKK